MTATCPWCSAPRDAGLVCPRCGADYAKAEAIKAHGRATPVVAVSEAAQRTQSRTDPALLIHAADADARQSVSDPLLEYRFCLAAIPLALCCAILFNASGLGASLQRIFLTMPVHEFGHAVSAWFCGYSAIPTLWKTIIPDTRGFIAPLALGSAIGYLLYCGYRAQTKPLLVAGGSLLMLQLVGTILFTPQTAQTWIIFGGDGAGMILATLLMASFFFGKQTQLYKGSLRWGFVVMGAAAFVDIYATWWKSRRDEGAMPYGTMDGMASDAMKLVETYGWTPQMLVSRYVTVGACCLVALTLVYAWGVWRAKAQLDAQKLAHKREGWAQRKTVM